jgi:hypothetical protein
MYLPDLVGRGVRRINWTGKGILRKARGKSRATMGVASSAL